MMNSKRVKVISASKKDVSKMEGARSYIGKNVISKSGDKVGKVLDVAFKGSTMEGVLVQKKLSTLFIDRKFFASVSNNALMLSINPVTMLLGKQVFDADGKKLGKVVKIVRKGGGNSFEAMMVRKNMVSKSIRVPKSEIDVSKKNIILKKAYV
jgi:sporulation protein YlmC with PRC-barrel domain